MEIGTPSQLSEVLDSDGTRLIKFPYGTPISAIVCSLVTSTVENKAPYKTIIDGIELHGESVSLDTYFQQKYGIGYMEALELSQKPDSGISMNFEIPESMKPSDKDKRLMALGHDTLRESMWPDFDQFVIEATRGQYKGNEINEIMPVISMINAAEIGKCDLAVKQFNRGAILDSDEYRQYKIDAIKRFTGTKGEHFEKMVTKA